MTALQNPQNGTNALAAISTTRMLRHMAISANGGHFAPEAYAYGFATMNGRSLNAEGRFCLDVMRTFRGVAKHIAMRKSVERCAEIMRKYNEDAAVWVAIAQANKIPY